MNVYQLGFGASALTRGLCGCSICGKLNRVNDPRWATCHRCGVILRARKPESLARTAAYTLAAAILYIPANVYPVLATRTIAGSERHTIVGGIVELWRGGSVPLALLVFFASVVVPLVKLIALTLLVATTWAGSGGHILARARLYRFVEFVGRWSMLDIYVIAILVALVRLRAVALTDAGPGAIAFAGVVVLTILAARAFDPRLMWDAARAQS